MSSDVFLLMSDKAMNGNKIITGVTILLVAFSLSACSSWRLESEAIEHIESGRYVEGVSLYEKIAATHPGKYRMKYIGARDEAAKDLLRYASAQRSAGDLDAATRLYLDVKKISPSNQQALQGIAAIERLQRNDEKLKNAKSLIDASETGLALSLINEVLLEDASSQEALYLKRGIQQESSRSSLLEPKLKSSMKKSVSLEFRNMNLQSVFEVLSQSSGLNFILDKDVKADLRTTLFAKNTTVEDALNLILKTNLLNFRILSDSTLLIYPSTPDKEKQYEDLVIRTFYLNNIDPKRMQEMMKSLVSPRFTYVDEKLKMLVVRDVVSVIETVERLVSAYDLADPEVLLEVEILEVNADNSLNLGVQYPDKVSATISGSTGKAGQVPLAELEDLDRGNFQINFPDPLAVLNLKQTSNKTKTLANPRIRVSNREKAKILIGDKVPVITTTVNQSSSATSESVSYLDVGLKLEVEPEVSVNNEVSIIVNLEVSNIVKEIKSTTGLLAYQIGTRNASTVLRLRDGETQVLAGLIKDENHDSASHLPGLGKIPVLGKLFSNETNSKSKSEIMLLITPRIVRSLATPSADTMEFASGTVSKPTTRPFRLSSGSQLNQTSKGLNGAVSGSSRSEAGLGKSVDAYKEPALSRAVQPNVLPASRPEVVTEQIDKVEPTVDLVFPSQVAVDKEFKLVLMLSSAQMDEMTVSIDFDRSSLEFVHASPMGAVGMFDVTQTETGSDVKLGQVSSTKGPAVMMTFKPTASSKNAVPVGITKLVSYVNGAAVTYTPMISKEIRIVR